MYFMFRHYANTPMQYTTIFHSCINDNFQMNFFDIFLIFAQNKDCEYTLEPPQRGGSNEYPQSMLIFFLFLLKTKIVSTR